MSVSKANLSLPNSSASLELPVYSAAIGNPVVDVSAVLPAGYFTYDPGFVATASTESKITYIDGDEGVLLYRGYPIEQIAKNSNFMECCYLLMYGELPDEQQYQEFSNNVTYHTMLHEQMKNFINGFRRDAHPMAIMCGMVGALSAFYHDSLDIQDERHREICAFRLIAKMPTIAAMSYKYTTGMPANYPRNKLNYCENFLHMMFANPCENYEPDPVIAQALDIIFILHADHEQNASTSTVRLAGSTGANPFACIAAGIAALWGPAHGGANEAALNMLREIGSVDKIDDYIKRAKDPDDSFRLMGFGHRVYKSYDPRAQVLKEICGDILDRTGSSDQQIFQVARKLEKIALEDSYFVERKLYPNVDFYSGIILNAIGIPPNMFTVIFALARTVGWISHWHEMISYPHKIGRPRQLYTGSIQRQFPHTGKPGNR